MEYLNGSNTHDVSRAIKLLSEDHVVAVPSETVYGLAASAFSEHACQKIFSVKKRPSDNPLIVHVADIEMALTLVRFQKPLIDIAQHFWPGPLTIVAPRIKTTQLCAFVSAGLNTVAVRCPSHPLFRALINEVGPLAAPSANASGKPSPTRAEHILQENLEGITAVLDGGACQGGLESTVIGLRNDDKITMYRPGMISEDQFIPFGQVVKPEGHDAPSPGMRHKHYAPAGRLLLNQRTKGNNDFYIGFGHGEHVDFQLSSNCDLEEAAHLLFHALKVADNQMAKTIAVAPIPRTGLGATINERLERAATKF